MPYKRKSFRRKRPRRFRRSRRRSIQGFSNKAPLPNTFYTKLRYSDSLSRTISAGSTDYWVYRANGLFDPDQSGTGHQPRGFDQFNLLYNSYTVVGAKITITAAPNESDGGDGNFVFGIAQRNSTASLTSNLVDYTEGRNVKSRMLTNGLSTESKLLTSTINIGKYLGVSKPLSDATLSGDSTKDPSSQAYFVIFSSAPTAAINRKIQYFVNIDYSVVFTKPKVLPLS